MCKLSEIVKVQRNRKSQKPSLLLTSCAEDLLRKVVISTSIWLTHLTHFTKKKKKKDNESSIVYIYYVYRQKVVEERWVFIWSSFHFF